MFSPGAQYGGFYISIFVTEIKHLKCFCFNDSSGEESAMVARKCLVLKVKSYDVVLYLFLLSSIHSNGPQRLHRTAAIVRNLKP